MLYFLQVSFLPHIVYSMGEDIKSLENFDTTMLFRSGWILEQLFEYDDSTVHTVYEEALHHASRYHEAHKDQEVGLKAASNREKWFWEVCRHQSSSNRP